MPNSYGYVFLQQTVNSNEWVLLFKLWKSQYTYAALGSMTDTARALIPCLSNYLGLCITL